VVQPRNGSGPVRWAGPVEHADPTGGRHAYDAEAALTPIFTTLRRGAWRRPRLRTAPPVLRPVPAPADRFRDDPPTAPIPVVPPLYAVPDDGFPPPPSQLETTMEWQPVDEWADPDPWHESPVEGRGRYAPHRGPAPYERRDGAADRYASPSGGYGPVRYEGHDLPPERYERYDRTGFNRHALRTSAPYDPHAYGPPGFGPPGFDQPGFDPHAYDPAVYDPHAFDPAAYDPPAYGRAAYDPTAYDPKAYDPTAYDPVTDTGRHHRRLAPAGW
jgi:hypothetical protein